MGEADINIKGGMQAQQIITGLHQINGQVLALSNEIKKQEILTRKAAAAHKRAAVATKQHANAMRAEAASHKRAAVAAKQHVNAMRAARASAKASAGAMAGLAIRFVGYNLILNQVMGAQQKLIAFVGESIAKYREFEVALAEVSTILQGEALVSMELLQAGIVNLSEKYGKGVKDLSKGMYDILSAAFDASSGVQLLNTATKAAVAGLSDVSVSVDVFTSILNAWGMTAAQAGVISDQLFQTVRRGKLVFEDLAKGMGYIAPIAANLGVEFKEIAAALSTVTRQGQHVDMATRGLALMIQNIAAGTPAASKAAIQYGVDLSDVALQVGGLEYILKQLNEAMATHGSQVLPEMIRNMRSLRVAMALVGAEGIAGYITDLGFLEDAEGNTEEAMAKMMNTQQMQVNILAQQTATMERSVGAMWSSSDLWIKKAKLWWAATLGGKDGDQEVSKFESRSRSIRKNLYETYTKSLETVEKLKSQSSITEIMGNVDLSQYDTIESKITAVTGALQEGFDTSLVNDYFTNLEKQEDKAHFITLVEGVKLKGQIILDDWNNLVDEYGIGQIPPEKITEMNELAIREGFGGIDFSQFKGKEFSWGGVLDTILSAPKSIGQIVTGLFDDMGDPAKKTNNNFIDFLNVLSETDAVTSRITSGGAEGMAQFVANLGENADGARVELGLLTEEGEFLAENEQALRGAIDNASMSISEHQGNILKLANAMQVLNFEVTDVYKTLGGDEFEGELYWEASLSGMNASFDRFQHYSEMAIKYGDDMETGYMDNINAIAEEFENLDLGDLTGISWYDEDLYKGLAAVEEYDMSMGDVIKTMGDYNETTKEVEKIQEDLKDSMDESRKALLGLNLEMIKIELKGMMRRRGLTRGEQKKMKQIQIEQTKIKIAQMEEQVAAQEASDELLTDELKDTYDEAKEIYDSYVDRMKFKIWEMGDTRDSDLQDFLLGIDTKEKRLVDYANLYDTELGKMEKSIVEYSALMGLIAGDKTLEENYRAIYGLEALESADKIMDEYKAFLVEHGVNPGEPDDPIEDEDGDDDDVIVPPPEPETHTLDSVSKYATGIRMLPYGVRLSSSSGTDKEVNLPSESVANTVYNAWKKQEGNEINWRRGTNYIPQDALYNLHRGETVIAAGKETGMGDNVSVSITVNAQVDTDYDVERLAAKLGASMQTQLANSRSGKSKYRMR